MKFNHTKKLGALLVGLVGTALITPDANAIPAFARKYDTACSSCHTAYPKLNAAGRKFKEDGYSFGDVAGEETISDYLHWDKSFPMSGAVVMRPYNKETGGGNTQVRALHEIELLSAGKVYKNVSTFFELESEDEDVNPAGDPYPTHVAAGMFTYNYAPALKVQLGYGQLFFADPYDSYTDGRRLTATRNAVNNSANANVDDMIRHGHQQVSIYGRLGDKFFYNVGYAGLDSDGFGDNSSQYFGRLAYDIAPDIMIGAMGTDGTCKIVTSGSEAGGAAAGCSATRDQSFSKYGIDTQIDIADFRINGAYMTTKDDKPVAGDESNDFAYLEALYTMRDGGRPTFVPLVRLDTFESNDGKDSTTAATLNLGYYFTENVKGFVEYRNEFDTPNGVEGKDRALVQLEAAF